MNIRNLLFGKRENRSARVVIPAEKMREMLSGYEKMGIFKYFSPAYRDNGVSWEKSDGAGFEGYWKNRRINRGHDSYNHNPRLDMRGYFGRPYSNSKSILSETLDKIDDWFSDAIKSVSNRKYFRKDFNNGFELKTVYSNGR